MDPGAKEGADDNDELFVRPVMRIAAPSASDTVATNHEICGKRQRSQVRCDACVSRGTRAHASRLYV